MGYDAGDAGGDPVGAVPGSTRQPPHRSRFPPRVMAKPDALVPGRDGGCMRGVPSIESAWTKETSTATPACWTLVGIRCTSSTSPDGRVSTLRTGTNSGPSSKTPRTAAAATAQWEHRAAPEQPHPIHLALSRRFRAHGVSMA